MLQYDRLQLGIFAITNICAALCTVKMYEVRIVLMHLGTKYVRNSLNSIEHVAFWLKIKICMGFEYVCKWYKIIT